MGNHSIEAFLRTPAAEDLRRRVEQGGAFSFSAVNPSAHPFLGSAIRKSFPNRPLLIVTELEHYNYSGATAISAVMLVVSFSLLLVINLLQWWTDRRHHALA